MIDELLHRESPGSAALKAPVDHETPEEVEAELARLLQQVFVVEHQEAGRFASRIDAPEPGERMEVGLRHGDRVGGDEALLLVGDREREHWPKGLGSDLLQRHGERSRHATQPALFGSERRNSLLTVSTIW